MKAFEQAEAKSASNKLKLKSEGKNLKTFRYEITPGMAEDQVWKNDVLPTFEPLPKNVIGIWEYCFPEMFNNAIDHSGGASIRVQTIRTLEASQIVVLDDGIGIFRKLQSAMNLLDERHAILELSKGKLTTSPANHTGEGIFFTSRLVDSFNILSGSAAFTRDPTVDEDWLFELEVPQSGTAVFMKLGNRTLRTCEEIFCHYSSADRCDFTKTIVPVKLALYAHEQLVSRSQAKRVVARVDLFRGCQ